jgi:MoaE-MoaD fusion protein
MRVSVRLFAGLHDLIGERTIALNVTEGATVSELRDRFAEEFPVATPYLNTIVCAVDEEYVPTDHKLRDGDEVALIPPVSGGSGAKLGPFRVTSEPLTPQELVEGVRTDESGAVALFYGIARNNSDGQRVVALEYDAFPSMAERKLRDVAEGIARDWPITGIGILHRTGRLQIGEASLLVAVSSAHRAEAFAACHEAVDRIKQVVPIWKKEIRPDGSGEWVAGHQVEPGEPALPPAR